MLQIRSTVVESFDAIRKSVSPWRTLYCLEDFDPADLAAGPNEVLEAPRPVAMTSASPAWIDPRAPIALRRRRSSTETR